MYTISLIIYGRVSIFRHFILMVMHLLWARQARRDAHRIYDDYVDTRAFYDNNQLLYDTADSTTGDTERHLSDFYNFTQSYKNELRVGRVVDVGCGNGVRMTKPIAEMLASCSVYGVDHVKPGQDFSLDNVSFVVGDFGRMPFPSGSVTLVTANWSVLNDLTSRAVQLKALREVRRVLKSGGFFYFDVPMLEGVGGYATEAKEYKRRHHDEMFGMIERVFPGDRVKRFYIYPSDELDALLQKNDLFIVHSWRWVTKSGQARRTVVSRRK